MATEKVALGRFLDSMEESLEDLHVSLSEVQWNLYLGDKKADPGPLQAEIWRLLNNSANRKKVLATRRAFKSGRVGRRAELLRIRFRHIVERMPLIFRVRDSLNRRIVSFKPRIYGKTVDRSDIYRILLRDERRSVRRKAWDSYHDLGATLKRRVKALMIQRNQEARRLRFKNFAEYSLRSAELTVDEAASIMQKIVRGTEDLYEEALERGRRLLKLQRLEPWDLSHLFYKVSSPPPDRYFRKANLVKTVLGTAMSLGFKVEELPIKIVEHDLPFGGLTFPIKIPVDIRILVNPRDGIEHYGTMLHEYGHALHAAYNRQQYFTLKAGEPGCFHEAMAQVTGWLARTEEWLGECMGVPHKFVEAYVVGARFQYSFRARSLATEALFEYSAYEDPTQDLDELHANVYERNMRVRMKASPRWASSSFYITHPIYLQNYLIADVVAVQTHHYLREQLGSIVGNPRVAPLLIEKYYANGARLPWKRKVRNATEHALSTRALLSEIRADS